jgi:serine/threonine protein kinase
MPTKSDIVIAIRNADKFLKLPELKDAKLKLNSSGYPYVCTGGFTMVFHLTKAKKHWAFRVWHANISNLKDRFREISEYLTDHKLPYFADFIYDEKSLLVDGVWIDTIRMEWIDGLLLKDYIEKNLHDGKSILNLACSFRAMCRDLHQNNISHGDLQHGNIIIDTNGAIRLIDYDSVCVPKTVGQYEFVRGLKGYQHPSRLKGDTYASPQADYFSELIIYLSIIALAKRPQLWVDYNIKDTETLLFNDADFENLPHSKIYSDLSAMQSDEITTLLAVLDNYLNTPSYLSLCPFDSLPNITDKVGELILDATVAKRKHKFDKALELLQEAYNLQPDNNPVIRLIEEIKKIKFKI